MDSRNSPNEMDVARHEIVLRARQMIADGLGIGSAGNLSVRVGDVVAITPSAVKYDDLLARDVSLVSLDGEPVLLDSNPSSETPMHLAVYRSSLARAVVHTHSPAVIAHSTVFDELPAIHYAIAALGGPVRVAPYIRFGGDALAQLAVQALEGRSAAILQNHGAITYGNSLTDAYERAQLLEWLADLYARAVALGTPRLLSPSDLADVTAEVRRRHYSSLTPVTEN